MPGPPAAFLSYTRDDDFHDDGFITDLRKELVAEIAALGVRDFVIFQDRFDLVWGDAWERRINAALDAATYLIPIVTPRFLQSPACRAEVERFLERERRLGRDDLILPLYYIPVTEIENPPDGSPDMIAHVITGRQFADWRDLRRRKITSRRVGSMISRLAGQVVARIGTDATATAPIEGRLDAAIHEVRFVNRPPDLVPNSFHDRVQVLGELVAMLDRPESRLVALVGGAGMGKTAMISQLAVRITDGVPQVDAFDYLSTRERPPVNAAAITNELVEAHPDPSARASLAACLRSEETWLRKLDIVLEQLAGRRVLLVIDNAETLLDGTGTVRDATLRSLIQDLAGRTDHRVQLLLVTAARPHPLIRGYAGGGTVSLTDGLPLPESVEFLKGLEPSGATGFGVATEAQIMRLHKQSGGRPRTLELVHATLVEHPETSLSGLLEAMRDQPADEMAMRLLDGLVKRLPRQAVQILRAVAVFGVPVAPDAIGRLLRDHVPTDELERLIVRMTARRILRHDDGQYYLPPDEAEHLSHRIPKGQATDRAALPVPITRIALMHHAADHFRHQVARTVVTRVEDLIPHFREIDLRVQGGDYMAAHRLIEDLDGDYLFKWGHSDALVQWRIRIEGKLDDAYAEVRNLAGIVEACRQQDDYPGQLNAIRRARRFNSRVGVERAELDLALRLMLAGAHFDDGRTGTALEEYEHALGVAQELGQTSDEAMALSGIAGCLVDIGRLDEAAGHQLAGMRLVAPSQDRESRQTYAELLLNFGVVELYRGSAREALMSVVRASEIAQSLDDVVLFAKCLDVQASCNLDLDAVPEALDWARQAVRVAARVGNSELSHTVNGTLALVYLAMDDLDAAAAVTKAALRAGVGRRDPHTLALHGLTEFHTGDRRTAEAAFVDAHAVAGVRLERERFRYQDWEADGLALAGLVMCGRRESVGAAERAYDFARARTSAPGVVKLCVRLLDVLAKGSDPELLDRVRFAARGDRSPRPVT